MIARNTCSRSDETSAHHQVKSPLTISEIRILMTCMLVQVVSADVAEAEIIRVAREAAGWNPRYTAAVMGSALRRARRAEAGERIMWNGRQVDPRYTPSAATMVEMLEVTDQEMQALGLHVLVDRGDRKRALSAERSREYRKRKGAKSHSESEAARLSLGRRALYLVSRDGMSVRDIAEEFGVSSSHVSKAMKVARDWKPEQNQSVSETSRPLIFHGPVGSQVAGLRGACPPPGLADQSQSAACPALPARTSRARPDQNDGEPQGRYGAVSGANAGRWQFRRPSFLRRGMESDAQGSDDRGSVGHETALALRPYSGHSDGCSSRNPVSRFESASSSEVSHSHTTRTRQPSFRSAASVARSRSTFRPSFASQKS